MVEYLTKAEVIALLDGASKEYMMENNNSAVKAIKTITDRVNKLYTVRPIETSRWKSLRANRDIIACETCNYLTKAYRTTQYCPQCGRLMTNGRKGAGK